MMVDVEADWAQRRIEAWDLEPPGPGWPLSIGLVLPKGMPLRVFEVGKLAPVREWNGAHKHGPTFTAMHWQPSTPPWGSK